MSPPALAIGTSGLRMAAGRQIMASTNGTALSALTMSACGSRIRTTCRNGTATHHMHEVGRAKVSTPSFLSSHDGDEKACDLDIKIAR